MDRRTLLCLAAAPLAAALRAPAWAATAPGAKLPTSDTARPGELFAVDFFNWRISSVRWLPDGAPFAQTIGAASGDGNGSLVITAAIKNNSSDTANMPTPNAQAIFKDGSATSENAVSAYTAGGKDLGNASYQPGAGATVAFVLRDVPKPTADNPITKLVFRQSYTGAKPELIRILDPGVVVGA